MRLGTVPRRSRGRPIARKLVRWAAPAGGVLLDPAAPREFPIAPLCAGRVSTELTGRLSAEDLRALDERLEGAPAAAWRAAPPELRPLLAPALALLLELDGVEERTGLQRVAPPEDVHAMTRGWEGPGGSYYYADLVAEALAEAGGELSGRALDFGCSSGRVVRTLRAWRPDVSWEGCDPNAESIAWASKQLKGIEFFCSPQEPPLPRPDAAFDLVFAISIWSHYSETAALRWFAEMERLVRPGGHLIITTQGWHSGHYLARWKLWSRDILDEAMAGMFRRGTYFQDVFGEEGDSGVSSPDWGMTWVSPEWLLTHLTPKWSVAYFRPGRVETNQDVMVLTRRGDRG